VAHFENETVQCWERGRPRPHSAERLAVELLSFSRFALIADEDVRVASNTTRKSKMYHYALA
jgi:hypothetical protein